MTQPLSAPYAGSIGHSGSSTSQRRAEYLETSGMARTYQQRTLCIAMSVGAYGVTCNELQSALTVGHGTASGCLSNLHHDGLLARLTEERHNQKVYVLPDSVGSRDTEPSRRNKDWKGLYEVACADLEAARQQITLLAADIQRLADAQDGRLF